MDLGGGQTNIVSGMLAGGGMLCQAWWPNWQKIWSKQGTVSISLRIIPLHAKCLLPTVGIPYVQSWKASQKLFFPFGGFLHSKQRRCQCSKPINLTMACSRYMRQFAVYSTVHLHQDCKYVWQSFGICKWPFWREHRVSSALKTTHFMNIWFAASRGLKTLCHCCQLIIYANIISRW